jgi:hypothetical protein
MHTRVKGKKMKAKIVAIAAAGAVAFTMLAAAPGASSGAVSLFNAPVESAGAAVTKSLSADGGGANVSGAGDRFGQLLSGWAVPVLTVLAGCLLVGTLLSRNMGAAFGIILITLVGLIFLLSPQSIESLAKGIANTVF